MNIEIDLDAIERDARVRWTINTDPEVMLELVRRLRESEADAARWREREAKIASLKARGFLGSPLRDAAMGEPK